MLCLCGGTQVRVLLLGCRGSPGAVGWRDAAELGWRRKNKLSVESQETCARHCRGQLCPKGQELSAVTELLAWERDRLGRVAGLSGVQVICHIHREEIGLR